VRIFLDTNVLFSGMYSQSGPPGTIVDRGIAGAVQLGTSVDALAELTRNVAMKAPHILGALGELLLGSTLEFAAPDQVMLDRCREAGCGADAPIVAAALGAEVDYFCTGDRRLLRRITRLDPGLRAVSPGELLGLLE
jgi:predicted nucleic acid-binding protein